MSGGALPFLPEAAEPSVASDDGIAELPFLVTEPPEATPDAPLDGEGVPAPVTGSAESSLNPFTPLLAPQLPAPDLAEPPAPPTETDTPAPPAVTQVPVPPEPTGEAAAPTPAPDASTLAPVPGARAPSAQTTVQDAGSLVQALADAARTRTANAPGAAPTNESLLLTRPASGAQRAWGDAFAEVATVRTPPPSVGAPVSQHPTQQTAGDTAPGVGAQNARANALGGQPTPRNTLATPAPLALNRSAEAARTNDRAANQIGRYLIQRQVSFTAMSTGTGIFRTADSSAPLLLAVGDPLPGSDVVLVSLTSSTAEFGRNDARHTLTLRQ